MVGAAVDLRQTQVCRTFDLLIFLTCPHARSRLPKTFVAVNVALNWQNSSTHGPRGKMSNRSSLRGDNTVHDAIFTNQKIWCPACKDHHQFLRIPSAARLLEVSCRTIYRHIEDGSIQVFKLGGTGRYRVCIGCLLGQSVPAKEPGSLTGSIIERNKL